MEGDKFKKLIDGIITEGESEVIEFKENDFREIEIGKRISALSNSANLLDKKNAYLVFGISDDKKIVGTSFSFKEFAARTPCAVRYSGRTGMNCRETGDYLDR